VSNWFSSISRSRCGNSIVTTPSGPSRILQAADEVVDVGHLGEHVVRDDQVGLPVARRRGLGRGRAEELDDSVGTPRSSAAFATLAAGSIPSTGMPFSTKYWRR
jgi:hypothetical protein